MAPRQAPSRSMQVVLCSFAAFALSVKARQALYPYGGGVSSEAECAPAERDERDAQRDERNTQRDERDAQRAPACVAHREAEREACNVMFVWEAARPLCYGQVCVVISDEEIIDLARLCAALSRRRASRLLTTPSLLAALLELAEGGGVSLPAPGAPHTWTLCGEVVTTSLVDQVWAAPESLPISESLSRFSQPRRRFGTPVSCPTAQ